VSSSSVRGKRLAGLSCLLAGIGLVVTARVATGRAGSHHVTLSPAPTSSAVAGSSASATPGVVAPPPSGPRTVDGDVVDTPYGPVQVAIVLDGDRIVEVKALQTPSDGGRSVRLAELATPILRQEVLRAQSAEVDTVSGATYTSDGYAQSVQYALDHR
jgi:hypothetical protein